MRDDALQETLLRAWRGIARFEPRSPIAAWLYLEPYPQPLVATGSEPATSAASREAIGLAFVAAMQLLPPGQRTILVLRDVLDWSARERLRREREEGSLARLHAPAAPGAEARVMRRFQEA